MEVLVARLGTEYPSLIERDAAHLRNAIAHHRPHEYLEAEGAVLLRDRHGWEKKFTLRELNEIAGRMFGMAGGLFPELMNVYLQDVVIRRQLPLLPPLCRAVVDDDVTALELIGQQFKQLEEELFAELGKLYGKPKTAA